MTAQRAMPVAVFLLSLFVLTGSVQAVPCNDPTAQLKAYLLENHSQEPLVVLAFDHQSQNWSGYRWEKNNLVLLEAESELKIPFTNKPRVFLTREETETLAVFVTNTNPLLFGTKLTGITETNIEDLASLQKLAGLLGGFLSAGVAGLAPQFEIPPLPPVEDSMMAFAIVDSTAQDLSEITEEDLTKIKASAALRRLHGDAEEIVKKLQDPASRIKTALSNLETPRSQFDEALGKLKEAGSEIKSYLQLVENDTLTATGPREFEKLQVTVSSLDGSAVTIATRRTELESIKLECTAALTLLRNAVRLYRIPLPAPLAEQRLAIDEFEGNLEGLADLSACTSVDLNPRIGRVRDELEKMHRSTGRPSVNGATSDEDRVLRPLFKGLDGYLTLVEQRKSALKTTADLLAEAGNAAKVAEAARTFLNLRDEALIGSDPCSLRAGVIPIPRHGELAGNLPWTKFGTESFQVTAVSPFKDSVVLRHAPEVSASYEFQRAWKWDFDVDVATTYTEVTSPVFTAVAVPNTATEKPDDTVNVPRQTDEEGRAGDLAMFLGLQWRSRTRTLFSVGPQLGVGLSTDHPALFAGIGFGIGRYVKLGVGWTIQEVKELEGQKVDRPLAAGESIRLHDGFDDNYYVSLSITLDELPFFKAP